MTETMKLTPAMQRAMWKIADRGSWETGADRAYPGRTYGALMRRGLITDASFGNRLVLTDAGRAWIVEQIEAARREATLEYASMLRGPDAIRLLVRSGLFGRQFTMPAPAVERDRCEAARLNYWCDNAALVISPCFIAGAWTAHGEQWCEWLGRKTGDPFANPTVDQLDALLANDHADAIRERLDRARAVEGFMATDEYHAARAAAQAAGLFPTMAVALR